MISSDATKSALFKISEDLEKLKKGVVLSENNERNDVDFLYEAFCNLLNCCEDDLSVIQMLLRSDPDCMQIQEKNRLNALEDYLKITSALYEEEENSPIGDVSN